MKFEDLNQLNKNREKSKAEVFAFFFNLSVNFGIMNKTKTLSRGKTYIEAGGIPAF